MHGRRTRAHRRWILFHARRRTQEEQRAGFVPLPRAGARHPPATASALALPRSAADHRAQVERSGTRAAHDPGNSCRARDRSGRSRIVWMARPAHGKKARTLHPDRRVAGRSPARPLPFVDSMAAGERSVSGVSSPRALGPDSRRLAQFHSARASGRAAGEGLDRQQSRRHEATARMGR